MVGRVAPKVVQSSLLRRVASIYTSVPMQVDQPPVIVGERTNTNGSRKFKQLLQKEDWDSMVAMAREQEREGAHMLDVCYSLCGTR